MTVTNIAAKRLTIEQLLQSPCLFEVAILLAQGFINLKKPYNYTGNKQILLVSDLKRPDGDVLDYSNYYFTFKILEVKTYINTSYSLRLGYTSELFDAYYGGENPDENFANLEQKWIDRIKAKKQKSH